MDENKTSTVVNSITEVLKDGPKSISSIHTKLKVNWRTAERYLSMLKSLEVVKEKSVKNTRTFFYLDQDNYFQLYIRRKDHELISNLYYYIKKFCNDLFGRDPTKTQAYKIIWKINQLLKLNLPIGWYKHGPCCVQVYRNNEAQTMNLSGKHLKIIRGVIQEYGSCENIALQKKIYLEADDKLYQAKEELLSIALQSKDEINPILMNLIKFAPAETLDVMTDFARATLLFGLENTKKCFTEYVWNYVAIVRFKETLFGYYNTDLGIYLDDKIADAKKEAQLHILDLVQCRTK